MPSSTIFRWEKDSELKFFRALLTNPQLLILDEPTSVLSPLALKALFQKLCASYLLRGRFNYLHYAQAQRNSSIVEKLLRHQRRPSSC